VRNQVAFVLTASLAVPFLVFEAKLMLRVLDSAFLDSLSVAGATTVLTLVSIASICVFLALWYGVFHLISFLLGKVVLPKGATFLKRLMA